MCIRDSGERQHVDIVSFYVDAHISNSLHCIGVEQHLIFAADFADLPDGLNGADLVVRVHNGHKSGILPDGILYIFRADVRCV